MLWRREGESMTAELTGREYGVLCRQKFAKYFENKWGSYELLGGSSYKFSNGRKVFTFFSSLNDANWWFGVLEEYWKNWDDQTYMALLMREEIKCFTVMLNSINSKKLLNWIQPDQKNRKHINVRIPAGPGKIYIQEWQDFPFEQNIIPLGNIELPKSPEEIFIERLSAMSKEEKEAFLEELKKKISTARDCNYLS